MRDLTAEDIIKINLTLINRFSPEEQLGVKDAEALAMSVEQPKQEVFGQELYPSVFEKAAILGINIIKRHIFFNGNKRTGFVAMVQFLALNGYRTNFTTDEAVKFSVDIAIGDSDFDDFKEAIAEILREKSQPV